MNGFLLIKGAPESSCSLFPPLQETVKSVSQSPRSPGPPSAGALISDSRSLELGNQPVLFFLFVLF